MNFGWYSKFLVQHPTWLLLFVGIFSMSCIIIPLTLKSVTLPSFKDPQLGFSTRGTKIANRLTTWINLAKSTRPSGEFIVNPKEYLKIKNQTQMHLNPHLKLPLKQPVKIKPIKSVKPTKKNIKKNKKVHKQPVYGSITTKQDINTSNSRMQSIDRWKSVQRLTTNPHKVMEDNFFCGNPDERYAHLVISTDARRNLFNLADLLTMCRLEHELIELKYFNDLCIQNDSRKCCRPWSLPNFVALYKKRSSCWAITAEDVEDTKSLLQKCSPYLHADEHNPKCLNHAPFCAAPDECLEHNTVYNMLNYITTISFIPTNDTDSLVVQDVMIFLPLACSTAIMPYYVELTKITVNHDGLKIFGIDFGIKNAVFDEYVVQDTYLMGFGATFVFMCIWVYTQSLFLTIMTIIVIGFSLAISYFLYILVFEIKFFPFMNLLATIVAIGIGSDDAFIFCKIWHIEREQDENISLTKIMCDTFQHAFMSMFVTAVTTFVAFLGSVISSVTAVRCFSIFAGMAVVANYILMMTWFPASIVIWERFFLTHEAFKSCLVMCSEKWCCIKLRLNLLAGFCNFFSIDKYFKNKENMIVDNIIKFKYLWCISLLTLAFVSGLVVLVYPKMQLPNSNEFQLFASSHPFEQYDFKYKDQFWFSRTEQMEYKLPLRFVWGVLPVDNGDHLDPSNLGKLTPDPDFDIAAPEAQVWLLSFCENVRQQPFYESMVGPLLSNCIVETFMKSMDRKCYDAFLGEDRTPCCEVAKFPFNRTVFNKCIIEEVADIYGTPSTLLPSGMAGPKFSKDENPTIKAIVVEYDSIFNYTLSYGKMDTFFRTVEAWMLKQLQTAPRSMRNGWFISELEFYDLQRELNLSTDLSVVISMGLAFIVLFFSTLNILISIYAIITITGSIFVTLAILVLLGWKLNILESTAVSTAIGLTVDFSLHYSVNYRMCPDDIASNREAATKFTLNYMAGPSFMAAVTTGAAGAFMLPSSVIPYIQIGTFLLIVMCVSWIYATFMLGSILAIMGPDRECGQYQYRSLLRLFWKGEKSHERALPGPSSSNSRELESLTLSKSGQSTPKLLKRSSSAGAVRYMPNKSELADQSPSATSAITIIMPDDNY